MPSRRHVTSGRLAVWEKTPPCRSAAIQPPRLTLLLAKPVAISYSQPNDSMVLHHSCSATGLWSGSTGDLY